MKKVNETILSEQELKDQGYRKYSGTDMDIYYSQTKCEHAGECVRGNAEVFEVGRKPWIMTDNGTNEENEAVLNLCPTGALQYKIKSEFTFAVEDRRIALYNAADEEIGEMTWSNAGTSLIIIDHTRVDDAYRGRGLANQLVEHGVQYAREHDKKIMPLCPFAKKVIENTPEFHDVLKQ